MYYTVRRFCATSNGLTVLQDDHRKLALAMRDFVDNVIAPEARIHELTGKPPSAELVTEMGRRNILCAAVSR